MIGRTRRVTSPIWSRIDWLTGPNIRIVGFSFAELDMDKTVHLDFFHCCLAGVNISFIRLFQFHDS